MGYQAGNHNTTGSENTFVGRSAGFSNTTGSENTFVGLAAGFHNTTGSNNTFVGRSAGINNTEGNFNTFVGIAAGFSNTTGIINTFMGYQAGNHNTEGSSNVCLGFAAGFSNTTGNENTCIGVQAGGLNITGVGNTFLGFRSGNNTDANSNTFLGHSTGFVNTSGVSNVFVGIFAGDENTTGGQNTFVGRNSGDGNMTGDNLEAFGVNAGPVVDELNNAFTFGSNSLITSNHSGTLGNLSLQKIGGSVNWGTTSDGRMKKGIKEDIKGLDFILQLRPVSYQIDALKLDKFLREDRNTSTNLELSEEEKAEEAKYKRAYKDYLKEKSNIRYTGFIAQEVEAVAEKTDFEFSGLVKPSHEKDPYSLRYAEFVVPLVKAVQEQQEVIKELEEKLTASAQLKQTVENQQQQINELQLLVEKLLVNTDVKAESRTAITLEETAHLEQNSPNPFNGETTIQYYLPKWAYDAQLQITDFNGKVLKVENNLTTGHGTISLAADALPSGTYSYSLLVDGKIVDTKRMVLVK